MYSIDFYVTDCDNLNNIVPHLINEMAKYNDIDLNSDFPDYCIKDIIKCYLYQSEYVYASLTKIWNKLIYIYIKRLLTLKIGQNVQHFFKRPFISSLLCLQKKNLMKYVHTPQICIHKLTFISWLDCLHELFDPRYGN